MTTDEFESWIEEGLSVSGIIGVERLTDERAADLCGQAATLYTSDGVGLRLWENLIRPLVMCDVESTELTTLINDLTGRCWFIPETGRTRKPVYGLQVRQIPLLLKKCPVSIQFYALGRELEWLITRSDHNQYYVLGTAISEKLKDLGEFFS